jgi:general secretion pathway protein J
VRRAPQYGFTLIELLVALSLLALLGLISWRGLDHISEQRARADADTVSTDRMLRTLAQMERDFGQRIPDRLFADSVPGNTPLPRSVEVMADEEGDIELRVLRSHPGIAGVQRVSYRLLDSVLVRQLYTEDQEANADKIEMLELRRLEVRCLVDGAWVEAQRLTMSAGRAMALEVTLERENAQRYVQVLPL